MRPFMLAASVAVAVIAAPAVAQAPALSWKTWTYAADGYQIDGPGQPQTQSQSVDNGNGASLPMNVVYFVGDGAAYLITATNVSSVPDAKTADPQAMVDSIKQGALQGQTLIAESNATYPGLATRDFSVGSNGKRIRMRAVYAYPFAYSVMVATDDAHAGALNDANAEKFFRSFKVLKR